MMQKLIVFNQVTLDGYFTGENGDLSWAHKPSDDAEWNAFIEGNASGGSTLLFGRVTYEMMVGYWPTPMASQTNPIVADRMNSGRKVVFSQTLADVSWNNTRLIKGDLLTEVQKLKEEPGQGMVILGSGSIVSQLAGTGLIDEYQVIVNPIVLGTGRTMFDGTERKVNLKLTNARTFGNGNVLLCYEPS